MAKNDNLTDFLADVANAIREKKGTTDLINPQDFSAEIASIETGGGGGAVVTEKDVNFRDYDGTLLHSYTTEQFLALSELPELPTRQGLICQGWNWPLEDAQSYVAEYGVLEVGATYITDDGKTRLYITIAAEGRMDVPLSFSQTVAKGVTIDWGDGATQTLSGTGNKGATHHYNAIGSYVITFDVADGCTLGLGIKNSSYCVLGENSAYSVYCSMLQKAEIGKGVKRIGTYAFNNCYSLSSIVIPQGVTSIENNVFYNCYSLASIVIPQGVTSIGNNVFYNCSSLASIVIPQGVTSIGTYAFNNCSSLASIVIPQGVTSIGGYTFNNCYSLASIVIPQSVTSIGNNTFYNCYSLASIVIPQGVTSIGNNVFYNCYSLASIVIPQGITSIGTNLFYKCTGMAFYDFTALNAVPSLAATSVFTSIPSDCKIVVPDALYDEWIAATNWSSYASYIIKASEFNA